MLADTQYSMTRIGRTFKQLNLVFSHFIFKFIRQNEIDNLIYHLFFHLIHSFNIVDA